MGMRRLFSLRQRVTPPPQSSAPMLDYVHRKERLRANNHIEPLPAGQAFPVMLEAIARAKRYVHVEVYILRDDFVGRGFPAALIERALAGVALRLLVDSLGSFGLPDAFVEELVAAGVRFAEFHP